MRDPDDDPGADVLTHALTRAAGGDPQLLDGLSRLAWESYVLAGLPYGADEEGMAQWWLDRMGARLGRDEEENT